MFPLLRRGPVWQRFLRLRRETDALLFELVDERRSENGDREDVLSMLLSARHEDGSPMSDAELRDELMTLLVAGHETTASQLAWAFERLGRSPEVLGRLTEEIDAGDDEAYLTATVQETLRHRPVLPNAAPRLVMRPVEIGGWEYPAGVCLIANGYLIHHDPAIYPDPYEFRPERFLSEPPGTYTWIPFGGGRRRCLGASFALLEMKIVLRAVLAQSRPVADGDGLDRTQPPARDHTQPAGGRRDRAARAPSRAGFRLRRAVGPEAPEVALRVARRVAAGAVVLVPELASELRPGFDRPGVMGVRVLDHEVEAAGPMAWLKTESPRG